MKKHGPIKVSAVAAALALALVLLLSGSACYAETWTPAGDGGLVGTFGQIKDDAAAQVVFGLYLYVGADDSLWRTDGSSWQRVDGGPDWGEVRSLCVVGSYLYVGTSSANGAELWRTACAGGPPFTDWVQVNADGFGDADNVTVRSMASYGGYLYAGTWNYTDGCQIWRTAAAGGPPYTDWVKVNSNGFGSAVDSVDSMLVYGGYLYAGTTLPCQLWRTAAAGGPPFTDWVEVSTEGFGSGCSGIRAMIQYGTDMYVATRNAMVGCEIWRTAGAGGPPFTDWVQVNTDGFGDEYSKEALAMVIFSGSLFVCVADYSVSRCEVWRTAGTGGPPFTDWVQVNTDGFGDVNNRQALSMAVFGTSLYVGTGNDTSGCEVWRTAGTGGPPFTDWARSNYPGFAMNNNTEVSSSIVFGGNLYVGTSSEHGCGVFRYSGGSTWVQVNADGFGNRGNNSACSMLEFDGSLYVGTTNGNGCQVWRTAGAGGPPFTDWVQVNTDGFGSSSNGGALSMVDYQSLLWIGTSNPDGCEIWQTNAVGGPPYTDWVEFVSGGFGDSHNTQATSMTVFDGSMMVGTHNSSTGAELWEKPGFWGWEQVNADGFGDANTDQVECLAVHDDALYAGTDRCEIWRTEGTGGPPYTDWSKVNATGFGVANNSRATAISSVGSYLYVGTENTTEGGEVWRGVEDATPPYVWTKASLSGLGDNDNEIVSTLALHGGELYAGTNNDTEGCEVWKAGSVVPAIASVVPDSADAGTLVTIGGNGFGLDPGTHASTYVRFGAFAPTEGDYVSWNDAEIQVRVPAGAFGPADVTVHTVGGGDSNSHPFSVTPHITSIDPTSGEAGSTLTIDGSAFGNTRGSSIVYFGATQAAGYVSWSNERITATVPVLAGTPVTVPVKVNTSGGDSNTLDYTENDPPVLTSISPTSGPKGTRVTLSGNSFGTTRGTSSVRFGAGTCQAADYVSWSDTTIVARVPSLATSGSVTVIKGAEISNPRTFTVTTAPIINSVTPSTAAPGDEVTIEGLAFGASGAGMSGGAASYVSFGGLPATDIVSWSDSQIKCKVPAGSTTSNLNVVTATGTSNSKGFTVIYPRWYLAEGSTAWGFSTYINIENPDEAERTVHITYNTAEGPVSGGDLVLTRTSQTTIDPRAVLGPKDFSTVVECTSSTNIAVDRTMTWTGTGASSPEAHSSIGVTCPARTWYLPEGSSAWGFETWVLIQNPGASEAVCTVTYMIEGAESVQKTKKVPAHSRLSFSMKDDIGERDASVKIASGQPVIAERAMYKNSRREGHESVGTTAAAGTYYLAEGTTAWGFTTYVLVQNPNDRAAEVTLTYMTSEGEVPQAPFDMPANSRKTIRVNDVLPGKDFSTAVSGSLPIIAERAMYWGAGQSEACHDSIGLSAAHKTFYLPDGGTTQGCETFLLVQNPNDSEVEIQVSYLPDEGSETRTFTGRIAAGSRVTYNMKDKLPVGSASILVTSRTAGKKIMCERAMYWNNRTAGTDTIGGFAD